MKLQEIRNLMGAQQSSCLRSPRPAGRGEWVVAKLPFWTMEYFAAPTLRNWENALLKNAEMAEEFRSLYLEILKDMGWTEEERDAEILKYIDLEWINIHRCAFFHAMDPFSIN